MNFRRLIIADDFGFNKSNDQAMLDLCNLKKIDGVSVFPKYISKTHANALSRLRENKDIKIGLHFNLTLDDNKNTIISIQRLLMNTIFGRVVKASIAKEFKLQLKIFKETFHHNPDFIDGHEHVHAFPVISKIICKELSLIKYSGLVRYIGSRSNDVLMRSIKYGFFLKFLTLEILSINQKRYLTKNNLAFNRSFEGLLPLNSSDKILKILKEIYSPKSFQSIIIMCHPGEHERGLQGNFFVSRDRETEKKFLSKS